MIQVAPRCRVFEKTESRGRKGSNSVRFDGRVDGKTLPPGTYELQLRSAEVVRRTRIVVVSGSEPLGRTEFAAARARDVCPPEQLGVPGWDAGAVAGSSSGGTADSQSASTPTGPTEGVLSAAQRSQPGEGSGGGRSFAPGTLFSETTQSPYGLLLVLAAALLLGVALIPRSAVPNARLAHAVAGRRVELAAMSVSVFVGVLVVQALG